MLLVVLDDVVNHRLLVNGGLPETRILNDPSSNRVANLAQVSELVVPCERFDRSLAFLAAWREAEVAVVDVRTEVVRLTIDFLLKKARTGVCSLQTPVREPLGKNKVHLCQSYRHHSCR